MQSEPLILSRPKSGIFPLNFYCLWSISSSFFFFYKYSFKNVLTQESVLNHFKAGTSMSVISHSFMSEIMIFGQ